MPSNRRTFLKTGIAATTTAILPQTVTRAAPMTESFITRNGSRFQANGQPFTMVGTNNFWMSYLYWDESQVDSVMNQAQQLGFNTLRTWGFGSGSQYLYQPAPGEYNEEAFERMDYIIKRAGDYGLKLIIALTNYWEDFGGMPQYVSWSDTASERDEFYTDDMCKGMYRTYVRDFLTRTNTYTGREYRNEPAIAIWELANEARHPSAPDGDGSVLHSWMDEMAGHVKEIDPNHLVSTGSEGYVLGEGAKYDDVAYWMNTQGSDFVGVHQSSNIDVASFHLYPDHWQISKEASVQFIKDRATEATNELNKPVYVGEFGRGVDRTATDVDAQIDARNTEYKTWYHTMDEYDVNGTLVWQLLEDTLYDEGDQFTIYYPRDSSTLDVLAQTASDLTETPANAPTIQNFTVSPSDQLGDNRMFSVQWEVADADGDLSLVEVVVSGPDLSLNFSTTQVSGKTASGWDLFQFPAGQAYDVTIRVSDQDNVVGKEQQTIQL